MAFTPRHMRKGYTNKSGDSGKDKQRAFKRAAQVSKRFIHQKASQLEGNYQYLQYCEATKDGNGFKKAG